MTKSALAHALSTCQQPHSAHKATHPAQDRSFDSNAFLRVCLQLVDCHPTYRTPRPWIPSFPTPASSASLAHSARKAKHSAQNAEQVNTSTIQAHQRVRRASPVCSPTEREPFSVAFARLEAEAQRFQARQLVCLVRLESSLVQV